MSRLATRTQTFDDTFRPTELSTAHALSQFGETKARRNLIFKAKYMVTVLGAKNSATYRTMCVCVCVFYLQRDTRARRKPIKTTKARESNISGDKDLSLIVFHND